MSLQGISATVQSMGGRDLVQAVEEDLAAFGNGRQATSYHPDDVEVMLSGFPDLHEATASAVSALSQWFPEGDRYRLAVTREPEMPTDRYLVIEVLTSLEPSTALERLAAFDRQWLSGQPGALTRRLSVDVAPR